MFLCLLRRAHLSAQVRVMSVFVDTKGDHRGGEALGRVVRVPGAQVVREAVKYGRVCWAIPKADRTGELNALVREVERVGDRIRRPWIRIKVDEAQQYSVTGVARGVTYQDAPLERLACEGLGLGVAVDFITQRPAGLNPGVRENFGEAIVFECTDEALGTLRSWRWPVDDWKQHLANAHHFVAYDGRATRFCRPVPLS